MKIVYYELALSTLTCDGYSNGVEILGNFFKKEDAEKYAEKWEKDHQKWDPYGIDYSASYDRTNGHVSFRFRIKEITLEIK